MSENKTLLTEAESKFIELTGQLANAFFELPEVHPADRGEFVAALHQIQNMVLARPAYRQLVLDDQGDEDV